MLKEEHSSERERILIFALNKYLSDGFYKTSMDALAGEMQVSKKTIYKHFGSKDVLVEEVTKYLLKTLGKRVDDALAEKNDAVTKLIALLNIVGENIMHLSDKWMDDIRLHAPELWDKVDRFRTQKIFSVISKLLEQGKKEGLFIDRPTEIMIAIFVSSVRAVLNPEFIFNNHFSITEALQIFFEIFFNGISTAKGKRIYNKSLKKVNI